MIEAQGPECGKPDGGTHEEHRDMGRCRRGHEPGCTDHSAKQEDGTMADAVEHPSPKQRGHADQDRASGERRGKS